MKKAITRTLLFVLITTLCITLIGCDFVNDIFGNSTSNQEDSTPNDSTQNNDLPPTDNTTPDDDRCPAGNTDTSMVESWNYTIIEQNGKNYIVFEDPTVYQIWAVDVATVEFNSLADFKDSVMNDKLSVWDKQIMITVFEKDEVGILTPDFNNLFEPYMPDEFQVDGLSWEGTYYAFGISSPSEVWGRVSSCSQENYNEIVQRDFERLFNQDTVWIEGAIEMDDEKSITTYSTVKNSRTYTKYTLSDENKTMLVVERTFGSEIDTDTVPETITLYCTEGDVHYVVNLYDFQERPSTSWLLEFGMQPYVDADENYDVPYSVSFSSIAEMKDFLNSAKGSAAQYEEFIQQNNINASITQSHAQHMATNVEQNDIPLVTSNSVADDFGATYYLDRNELDIIYKINGIRYRFVYKYNKTSNFAPTTPPVLENVNLGTYVFDLYQGDGCFVGELVTDSAVVQVVVYAEQTNDVALNVFNMEILQSSDKTPIEDPLPSQSIEISGLEKFNEMKAMLADNDEAQLEQYIQSIANSGIQSKDDMTAFVKLLDFLPQISVLDGNVTSIRFSHTVSEDTGKETNVVYITTEAANGEWTRVEYVLSVTDVTQKISDEKMSIGESSLLTSAVKNSDGKLTLHIETRKPHQSGTGTLIQWVGEANGIFTRIFYYTNDSDNIKADNLFSNIQIPAIS